MKFYFETESCSILTTLPKTIWLIERVITSDKEIYKEAKKICLGNTFYKEPTIQIFKLSREIFLLIPNFYLNPCALNPNHTPNCTHTNLLHLLKHLVWRRLYAWDQVGGAEGQLFHLSEVIGGVLVKHHTPYLDERIHRLRPYL